MHVGPDCALPGKRVSACGLPGAGTTHRRDRQLRLAVASPSVPGTTDGRADRESTAGRRATASDRQLGLSPESAAHLLDEVGRPDRPGVRPGAGRDRGQPSRGARGPRAAGRSPRSSRPARTCTSAGGRRSPSRATRWALSYWSQKSGSRIIGRPSWKHSVTVLLPPWVMTRSTWGRIARCGRNSAPTMLSASSYWSCLGPLRDDEPVGRPAEDVDQPAHQLDVGRAEAAQAEVDERARPAGEHRPGSPRLASVVRTHDSRRCQVGASGRARA